ncbi:efflux RND transporter periplasmic adaptor subunit [Roseivirga pacifica]|uniref:efflux RND transporter periplasmic adaptor subunit n=1 Tax=Roseivirga pacifica TaxID=1267423 RepID=UPI003BAFB5F9
MKNIKNLLLTLPLALFAACSNGEPNETHTVNPSETANAAANYVQVGKLAVKPLSEEIYSTGTIDVPPMERKVIHSYLEANVTYVNVIQGQTVKQGQVIAKLSHPNLIALQQTLLESKTEIDFQQGELERKTKLAESNAASAKELNAIKRQLDMAKITFESAKEHLALLGISEAQVLNSGPKKEISIKAPFSGKVSKVHVTNGQFVSVNQPLVEVLNTHHKHLELDVFAKNADKVKLGQTIHFNIPGSSQVFSGKVYLINPDITGNKLRVHGHLDNEEIDLKVGTFIEAKITINNEAVAQIGNEEIIREGDKFFLFRPVPSGYEKVAITKGRSNEQYSELIGIDTTQQWVIAGNYYLQ